MRKKLLGADLEVSAIGLGCMGMHHAYGAIADKKEMIRLISKAVDMGYTFFDTAEIYGTSDDPHGNESLVGEALKPYRDSVVIATKFGISFDMTGTEPNKPLIPEARPDVIRKSVEQSLLRLKTDHIDLYYQHRTDPDVAPEDVAEVMSDLMAEGKILHWGLSEMSEEYLRRAHSVCPVTAVQNRFSMMARWHEKIFPVLEELNIGFVAFSPLANVFLSGKYNAMSVFEKNTDYRAIMPQFRKDSYVKNRDFLNWLKILADEKNATLSQISLAWILNKKPYLVAIPGTRKPERLKENAGASESYLTSEEVKNIDDMLKNLPMSEFFGGTKVAK